MAYRYAVYFVPSDDSDLYEFGARWLGRDSLGQKRPPFDIQNLTLHEWEKVISGPRKYGFHATLNPPFPLEKRFSERQFYEAVQQFSASHKHVVIGKLRLIQLGGFLALCPIKLNAGRELAADCLHEFECFRAPITDKEILNRNPVTLTQNQRNLLRRWGYPYVLNEFRFHMTLSGNVSAAMITLVSEGLQKLLIAITQSEVTIRDLCVFVQTSPSANFQLAERFPMGLS